MFISSELSAASRALTKQGKSGGGSLTSNSFNQEFKTDNYNSANQQAHIMGVGKKKSLQSNLANSREGSVSPTPNARKSNPGSGAKLSEYNLDEVDI